MSLTEEEADRLHTFLDEAGHHPTHDLPWSTIVPVYLSLQERLISHYEVLSHLMEPFLDEIISLRAQIDLRTEMGRRVSEIWREEADHERALLSEIRARHYPFGPYCLICDPDGRNNPDCPHERRVCVLCRDSTWPCDTARIAGWLPQTT